MRALILIWVLLSSSPLGPAMSYRLAVVWNVGQGQWVTIRYHDQCHHFDVGGESRPPQKLLQKLCPKNTTQALFLSHWDWIT